MTPEVPPPADRFVSPPDSALTQGCGLTILNL